MGGEWEESGRRVGGGRCGRGLEGGRGVRCLLLLAAGGTADSSGGFGALLTRLNAEELAELDEDEMLETEEAEVAEFEAIDALRLTLAALLEAEHSCLPAQTSPQNWCLYPLTSVVHSACTKWPQVSHRLHSTPLGGRVSPHARQHCLSRSSGACSWGFTLLKAFKTVCAPL
mgnify:CR=1 FL=1